MQMHTVVEDDAAWADRNECWHTLADRPSRRAAKRERRREPLILCGHGVRLRVDRGTLLVDDGLTHFPQERRQFRYFKGDLNLPSRIVVLDGSGSLTFDVMTWLAEQSVPLVRADFRGEVTSVIGGTGYSADPDRLRWQVETRNDPERRLEFCCDLVATKLRSSLHTLTSHVPESRARQVAIARAEAGIHRLERRAVASVDDVRQVEMSAAGDYFTAWRGFELKWRSRWKHPVPDDWLTISSRRSMRRPMANNRGATHPVNALLNYAYALLRSVVHIDIVASGFDPRRGIMHHDRDEADAFAFVFDVMEPGRLIADAAVLRFLGNHELTGADFVIRTDGVCRVVPQLVRAFAKDVLRACGEADLLMNLVDAAA